MPDVPPIAPGTSGPADRLHPTANGHAGVRGAGLLNGSAEVGPRRPADRVELSPHAHILERLRSMEPARLGLVEEVRRRIARGAYETPEKLRIALERLLSDLG